MFNSFVVFLERFSEWCHDLGTIVLLPIMILIITANVFLRYIFNAPLSWGEEMNGMLLFLVLFLSMTYTWDQKRHIRMEIVYVLLKGRWRSFADILTGITGIIFFGILGIQSIRDIPYMIKTHETGAEVGIPLWPFRVVMALISLIFVIKLVIYLFRGRKEIEKEEVVTEREGIIILKGDK
jgi:TRAP-type C4-dicarboxylate transport system permease small subunit